MSGCRGNGSQAASNPAERRTEAIQIAGQGDEEANQLMRDISDRVLQRSISFRMNVGNAEHDDENDEEDNPIEEEHREHTNQEVFVIEDIDNAEGEAGVVNIEDLDIEYIDAAVTGAQRADEGMELKEFAQLGTEYWKDQAFADSILGTEDGKEGEETNEHGEKQ